MAAVTKDVSADLEEDARWLIGDRAGRLAIELDRHTGLMVALHVENGRGSLERMPVRIGATLVTEGIEIDGQPFGLAYAETVDCSDFELLSPVVSHRYAGYEDVVVVLTRTGTWQVAWEYHFRGSTPRLEVGIELSPTGPGRGTVRNLILTIDVALPDIERWRIHAPGSPVRPGLASTELESPIEISEPTFSGSGIVVLDQPDMETSLLLWPFSRTEHAVNRLQPQDDRLNLVVATSLAGRIGPDEILPWKGLQLDLLPATWDALRPRANTWFRTLAVSAPADTARWIPGTSIFEVQIGESVFWGGYTYSPYPTMRHLLDDLERIVGLGFEVIQVMPRQPFPSYNVYDYTDITLSYGDEDDLKAVVARAHELGMKVILDILMHGVIDADIIGRAADRIRQGPYFARLDEGTGIVPDPGFTAYDGQDYLVSWARHIIDFEPYWAGGSPGSHPLVEEHPEWFVRRTDGEIIGVYTKAFDVSNLAWQEYFTQAALNLVRTLGIDGFRFDAPTYNEFPNWSPATERRASAQQLGSVEHFARLRTELKALDPGVMLYTEPSGTLFRQTMDITYNYDEHWLFHAVLRPERSLERNPVGIRHARDLAAWFRDKEAVLPQGAMTARHIDSHDTFWWPLPGFKWRREQYGIPATRALLAVWSLMGGVYMSFVGGETGLESEVQRVNRLRKELPEVRYGVSDFDAVSASDDRVFAVARIFEDRTSAFLVNLSPDSFTTRINIDRLVHDVSGMTLSDLWDASITHSDADLESLSFVPYQAYLLTLPWTALSP